MIRKHQAFVTFGCPSRPFGTLGCHCALGCPWGPLGAIGCPWVSEGPLDAIGGSWVPWQLLGALGCPCELSGAFGCRWMHLETICCIVGDIGKHWMPYVLSASIIVVVLDWKLQDGPIQIWQKRAIWWWENDTIHDGFLIGYRSIVWKHLWYDICQCQTLKRIHQEYNLFKN